MSRDDMRLVRQQVGNCWFCVLTSGTPSTQARKGSWLLEAPAAAGVSRTKVHKGQPEWPAGIWVRSLPPESGLPSWALVCVLSLHTACGGPSGGRVEDPGDFTLEAGLMG